MKDKEKTKLMRKLTKTNCPEAYFMHRPVFDDKDSDDDDDDGRDDDDDDGRDDDDRTKYCRP